MYAQGPQTLQRQALHCGRLWLCHPLTGERVEVCSPLPDDMRDFALAQGWSLPG